MPMRTPSMTADMSSLRGATRRRDVLRGLARMASRSPLAVVGGAVVAVMVLTAIFADVVAPHDPFKLYYEAVFEPPGAKFLLGTDNLGRDILSRIIHGARISLYVGVLAVALGQVAGGVIGLVGGYFGQRIDLVAQRCMDMLMSFPTLVLALAIVAALGPSVNNMVIAIALVQTPRVARVIRSAVIAVRQAQYVEAARAIGAQDARIIVRHVFPQVVAPFVIIASVELPHAILVEASLSFLGLGIPAPAPSWGGMLAKAGREFAEVAPWIGIFPGVAISLAVFGFNFLGDGLRDVLDPRLRGT